MAWTAFDAGHPSRVWRLPGQQHNCVAIIAPPTMGKEDRADAELSGRVAQRFGLKMVYKRSLLAGLREAHSPEELALMERAIAITRFGHEAVGEGYGPRRFRTRRANAAGVRIFF